MLAKFEGSTPPIFGGILCAEAGADYRLSPVPVPPAVPS